jgi:hypothetical protein
VLVQDRYVVCPKRTIGLEIILDAPDRCSVYTKRTIGSKIVLHTLDGTPRLRGPIGSSFQSFGDCANLDVR